MASSQRHAVGFLISSCSDVNLDLRWLKQNVWRPRVDGRPITYLWVLHTGWRIVNGCSLYINWILNKSSWIHLSEHSRQIQAWIFLFKLGWKQTFFPKSLDVIWYPMPENGGKPKLIQAEFWNGQPEILWDQPLFGRTVRLIQFTSIPFNEFFPPNFAQMFSPLKLISHPQWSVQFRWLDNSM